MYVQDRIREQAKVVYHAIAVKQGLVYVCGYVLDTLLRIVLILRRSYLEV